MFRLFSLYQALSQTKLEIEKNMQHNNTKMHESTNEKILTERKQIQENGKFEKKWKNVSQFSSNFIFCGNAKAGPNFSAS